MIRHFSLVAFLAVFFLFSFKGIAAEGRASVMLFPTRIVMESSDKTATVQLKNSGTATGQFVISLIDMEMREDGGVVALQQDAVEPFSAIPYLHISPKSVTLKPGENQTIRIMQKRNLNPEPGEYRAHLKVRMENDNVEGDSTPKRSSISIKPNIVLIMPIIMRVGETNFTVKIEEPHLKMDSVVKSAKPEKPKLEMYLAREGNRSAMGDFSVYYKPPTGEKRLITFFPGVPVYRPTPRRLVSIPLDVPKGLSLNQGSLEITYSAQEKEGGKELAQTSLNLK